MQRASNRLPDLSTSPLQSALTRIAIVVVLLAVVTVNVSLRLGNALAGTPADLPANPIEVPFDLALGRLTWPGTWGTAVLVAQLVLAAAVVVLWLLARHHRAHGPRGTGRRELVDEAAQYMARGKELDVLTRKAVAQRAQSLGVPQDISPGLPIGVSVYDRVELLSSWEDMRLTVMGPRMGKTTSLVVPQVLAAPGAVLVTSNKRDIVDDLLAVRAEGGTCWVFDPQGVLDADSQPGPNSGAGEGRWWWNPLDSVRDEASAADLAAHFASAARRPGDRADAYFQGQGELLLAALLLAAAVDNRPISRVWGWLTDPTDRSAAEALSRHGLDLQADLVTGIINLTDKTRGGIFSSAQQMTSCLADRRLLAWITPPGTVEAAPARAAASAAAVDGQIAVTAAGSLRHKTVGTRTRFYAEQFVLSSQPRKGPGGTPSAPTLFSLSREGAGSAGPIVLALTAAVVQAAETHAATSPRGRLPVPMIVVLDEAANVCRWANLPDLYSHYGSRGICIDTVLQSWPQGVEVWGKTGMEKLWSAANVKVIGGGSADADLLPRLSTLIGDRDRVTTSTSTSWGSGRSGQRSSSQQMTRERILDEAALASLPRGRAVVLASGMRPTLARTVMWVDGPHAQLVRAASHSGGLDQAPVA